MRVFRVLIIDDVGFDLIRRDWQNGRGEPAVFLSLREPLRVTTTIDDLIVRLHRLQTRCLQLDHGQLHAYVARDVFFDLDSPATFAVTSNTPPWQNEFLSELDVLVLDLGFKDRVSPRRWLLPPDLTGDQDLAIRTDLHGVGFYLNETIKPKGRLLSCQCVVILSQHDGFETPAAVKELIDPRCHDDSLPFTVKFKAGSGDYGRTGFAATAELIESLTHDFFNGYTQLDHRGAIEFAASHNEPVLIVGETGTGKEYIARAIHRRWALEQERLGNKNANGSLVVVNCASLSERLARTELFGAVHGSYTDSQGHQVGLILEACGFKRPPPGRGADFSEALRAASNGRLKQSGDLRMVGSGPFGTMFLDELADLPIEVQTYLLRYLESYEVLAFGFATPVENARVRLIAATSDPRVATFVGESVFSPRTSSELARPLRDDFLFRLKGQIIRTQPVTSGNALSIVQHAVRSDHDHSSHESSRDSDLAWSHDAVRYLAERIGGLADKIQGSLATGEDVGARFGHRREVVRIVRLANAYVREARRRGLRAMEREVTREVIDRVWKPSHVASSTLGSVSTQTSFTGRPTSAEEIRKRLEEICEEGGHPLPSKWGSDIFRGHVRAHGFFRGTSTGDKLNAEILGFINAPETHGHLRSALEGFRGKDLRTIPTWFSEARAR